jgi:rfaE bifunctional protein kinase chain/domain
MTKLIGTFSRLGPAKVLVIGDILLDTYTLGKARRISPEAPVPVITVEKEEMLPGGAGNVILNLISMGCTVIPIGRVGNDLAGASLIDSFSKENITTEGLFTQNQYSTPVKNRIIADNQQIVRVDHEKITPLPELLEQQIIEKLPILLEGCKVIAISDYGKGFLTRTLLNAVIEHGKERNIPTITDPKGIDFSKYTTTTVIKPNLGEAFAAANMSSDTPLEQVASRVLHLTQAEVLMITRSEAGISLFFKNGTRQDFPVQIRQVKDVTGAGDTVLAMFACALANGLSFAEAAGLSNIAAGIAIEHIGCARVSLSQLARRLLQHDVNNKVFDEEHLFALQEALRGATFNLLGVHSVNGLTSPIYTAIRQLSQNGSQLLLYIKDEEPDLNFIQILASLLEVNFILIKGQSLRALCEQISPNAIYEIKGNSYIPVDNPVALLS